VLAADAGGNSHRGLGKTSASNSLPAWSPDSRKLVFLSNRDGGTFEHIPIFRLYVMKADGSNQHPVIVNDMDDFGPNWSPDGHQLAFDRALPAGVQVFVSNADGTNQHILTPSTGGQAVPGWHPRPRHHRCVGRTQ
jgi:TolB protein